MKIDADLFVALFTEGHEPKFRVLDGFKPNVKARCVHASLDVYGQVVLVWESEQFDEIGVGELLPDFQPVLQKMPDVYLKETTPVGDAAGQ